MDIGKAPPVRSYVMVCLTAVTTDGGWFADFPEECVGMSGYRGAASFFSWALAMSV